jgi:hypothetical protein
MNKLKYNYSYEVPRRQIVIKGADQIKRLDRLINHISDICGDKMSAKATINWITEQFENDKIVFNV